MSDRKAFLISTLAVAAMLAAAFWRVSVLENWTQLPHYGEDGASLLPIHSASLLILPCALVFVMMLFAVRSRMVMATDEEMRPWRNWVRLYLVPLSAIVVIFQAFIILRSLHSLPGLSPAVFSRILLVVLGLLLMVINNAIPKLPWLRSRLSFLNLDSNTGAALLRRKGQTGFVLGLSIVLLALLVPAKFLTAAIVTMIAASAAVRGWLFVAAKRGQLP